MYVPNLGPRPSCPGFELYPALPFGQDVGQVTWLGLPLASSVYRHVPVSVQQRNIALLAKLAARLG